MTAKVQWSDGGQACFIDGYGWGLTKDLKSIPLGKEDKIKKFFETGELNNELHPIQKQTLTQIKEYREEQSFGTTNRPKSVERTSNDGITGGKPKTISTPHTRQKSTRRSAHKKH